MKFENRFEFAEWLGNLLNEKLENVTEYVNSEENRITGRCELEIKFKNGDSVTLSISMQDNEYNQK